MKDSTTKIYIGYDSRQDYPPKFSGIKNPCYEVCKQSILNYNKDVNIIPIKLDELINKGLYYRDISGSGPTAGIFNQQKSHCYRRQK